MVYLIAGIFIVSTGICHYTARRKQLSVPFWIVLGTLVGPLAVLLVVLAKSKNPPSGAS